jgi:N-glycosylase/DNA lyase
MSLVSLVNQVNKLKKKPVNKIIKQRMSEFEKLKKARSDTLFSELCFCLLTANFDAEKTIKIQKAIGVKGFLNLTQKQLSKRLRELGHRFPNTRARYIVEARKHSKKLNQELNSFDSDFEKREWLVKNIKGLGYKEASHFLRNTGFEDVAIVDFHIIDLLVRNKLIVKPKALTKKKYLEVEKVLKKIADKTHLSLGELDLFLWFLETGKVLK